MSKKEKQQMPRYCERKEHKKFRSVSLKQRRGVHCEKRMERRTDQAMQGLVRHLNS